VIFLGKHHRSVQHGSKAILPGAGEVDIWSFSLSNPEIFDFTLAIRSISPAERERMKKFVYQRDRDLFVMRRFCIRSVIAGYFGASPADVRLLRSPTGKPLFGGFEGRGVKDHLELSMSHTKGQAILAVATWAPVGIDIEFRDPTLNTEDIVNFCCSEHELEWFRQAQDRLSRFLKIWTAKEASLKLSGTGLVVDPRSVECRMGKSGSVFVEWRDGSFGPCRVIPVPAGKDFIASLAVMPGYSTYRMQSGACIADQ
jgi:4'-phosphopantetheinyl transferase